MYIYIVVEPQSCFYRLAWSLWFHLTFVLFRSFHQASARMAWLDINHWSLCRGLDCHSISSGWWLSQLSQLPLWKMMEWTEWTSVGMICFHSQPPWKIWWSSSMGKDYPIIYIYIIEKTNNFQNLPNHQAVLVWAKFGTFLPLWVLWVHGIHRIGERSVAALHAGAARYGPGPEGRGLEPEAAFSHSLPGKNNALGASKRDSQKWRIMDNPFSNMMIVN